MKQKDITLIAVIAIFSVVFAAVTSNLLLGQFAPKKQSAEVVEPISAAFQQPSTAYFNSDSIDPTQIIRIGDGSNQQPFDDEAQ